LVDPVLVLLCFRNTRYIAPAVLAQLASLSAYVPFSVLAYDPDNWLLGPEGALKRLLGLGLGIFPALGGLSMAAALLLLLKYAHQLRDRPDRAMPRADTLIPGAA
jgi:hypothetical protein